MLNLSLGTAHYEVSLNVKLFFPEKKASQQQQLQQQLYNLSWTFTNLPQNWSKISLKTINGYPERLS